MIPFDHRKSIEKYLDDQADKYEARGRRNEATLLRAMASNVKAELDVVSGRGEIATPVDAIAIAVCDRLGGCSWQELFQQSKARDVVHLRDAAIWIVRKRFEWTYECIGAYFNRDQSSVRDALKRADEAREQDSTFKAVTDDLAASAIRCQHCTENLLLV
jgi:chromosomal replication initiation ATPase DnaA